MMMGVKECCTTFLAALPNPALPLLPSFILGTVFSALILLYFYSKESQLGVGETVKMLLRNLFYLLPKHERQTCRNPDCVRCHKYQELLTQVEHRWREVKCRNPKLDLRRVETAIQRLPVDGNASPLVEEVTVKRDSGRKLRFSEKSQNDKKKRLHYLEFQKPTVFHMDLPANPYWGDLDVYRNETELLKLNFQIILKEFKSVFGVLQDGNHTGWKLNDVESGHWCIFPFIDQGMVNEANCRRCPNTTTLLGSLPPIMKDCVFGNACFSVLYPDSVISSHYGPSNIRLRCHLGLEVPGGCWLEVAGTQHHWRPSQCLIFDDSFLHSATFTTTSGPTQTDHRAVLMVDFWHPDITRHEREALTHLLSPS